MKKIYFIIIFSLIPTCFISAQNSDTLWAEDWEGNWVNDWHVDAGTWEVGIPTSGPGSPYMGQKCAATSLSGNYSDGIESRLIRHLNFKVPSKEHIPRIRFRHWYSFSSNDYGSVQVKTPTGNWEDVSSQYWNTSSGIWTHAFIDLAAYADSTIQIAFFIHTASSYSGSNVSSGWYIDNITMETGDQSYDNPESWESGIGDWYADFSIWQIGEPASGPGCAFSGLNCAATILNGNYTDNRESKLISPQFKVPALVENPRLRFQHWYSFSSNDYGCVMIKTETQEWKKLSPEYTATSSGIWTHAFIDLAAYADSTIQIAFFIHTASSYSGSNVSSGWYFDDVSIETGNLPFNNPEDWEEGFRNWYADFSIWQIGVPNSGPDSAYSGNQCAATILDGNYTDNRVSRLISPFFIVPNKSQNPALRFWHWFSFSSNDYGNVQIRTKNGEWEVISNNYSATSSNIWSNTFFNLNAYADSTVQISFYIYTASSYSGSNESTGWYIDDVSIANYQVPILYVYPDKIDFDSIELNHSQTDSVTVSNFGTDTLHVSKIVIAGDNKECFVTDTTTFSLLPDSSKYLPVTFSPTLLYNYDDRLKIYSDGGYWPVTLLGTGVKDTTTSLTGIKKFPIVFSLKQNYPNPFNPVTKIKFSLSKASNVKLEAFNVLGQKVATMLNTYKPAGYYEVTFDARKLASGMYYYKIETEEFVQIKKMLFIK